MRITLRICCDWVFWPQDPSWRQSTALCAIWHESGCNWCMAEPQKHYYSLELGAQVRQECRQSGQSLAVIALPHSIRANIFHRWLHKEDRA